MRPAPDFFEDDEDPRRVLAVFESGQQRVTTQPPISRHVAELLGIPLDDPDVAREV
ncbi:hypothetical protein [Nonomuraea typhae]|uniref:hypothetical protein n=1 Tax=Nonomuraea typhae TaxID=2603600 RepID=UPI0012FA8387|nr:hypothetical protein [Nonomuraea typhae]